MAREFGFENHEGERGEEQQDGRVLDGEQVETEDGEQDHECTECAGNDGSGDAELEVDKQAAGQGAEARRGRGW